MKKIIFGTLVAFTASLHSFAGICEKEYAELEALEVEFMRVVFPSVVANVGVGRNIVDSSNNLLKLNETNSIDISLAESVATEAKKLRKDVFESSELLYPFSGSSHSAHAKMDSCIEKSNKKHCVFFANNLAINAKSIINYSSKMNDSAKEATYNYDKMAEAIVKAVSENREVSMTIIRKTIRTGEISVRNYDSIFPWVKRELDERNWQFGKLSSCLLSD